MQVEEILSSGESRGLFLKPSLASPFLALRGAAKHLPCPRATQKLARDTGTRRMLSDPKVLAGDPTPTAVCANVCVSVWGGLGPKGKHMLFALQGKAHHRTQPILERRARSRGIHRDRGLHDRD